MTLPDLDKEQSILTFLACARQGGHPRASTGERACHTLAKLAPQISGLMQDIDASNKDGFLEILRVLDWPDTRQGMLRMLPK